MSVFLNILVEGETERRFISQTLAPYLRNYGIETYIRVVLTKRDLKTGEEYRGGMSKYNLPRDELLRWMEEDTAGTMWYTTMFDLYQLPGGFPGYSKSEQLSDPYRRIHAIEDAFKQDIHSPRFIPYIQLHEFETLLFSDPGALRLEFFDKAREIENLQKIVQGMPDQNPELINDGVDTAPSKRIIRQIPEYRDAKASSGPLIVRNIGMERLLARCIHFRMWVEQLQMIATT